MALLTFLIADDLLPFAEFSLCRTNTSGNLWLNIVTLSTFYYLPFINNIIIIFNSKWLSNFWLNDSQPGGWDLQKGHKINLKGSEMMAQDGEMVKTSGLKES